MVSAIKKQLFCTLFNTKKAEELEFLAEGVKSSSKTSSAFLTWNERQNFDQNSFIILLENHNTAMVHFSRKMEL